MNKKRLITPLLSLSFIICSGAIAATSVRSVFTNSNCLNTDSCDLKSFEITVTRENYKQESDFGADNIYSTTAMEGFYETTDASLVEKYAIVQFIKGGLFRLSALNSDPLALNHNTAREFFGQDYRPFIHSEWVVDSFDDDPIYASYSDQNDRHGLYRVKEDESRSVIFDDRKYFEYYFYRPELKTPRLHFSDMPTGGSYTPVDIAAGDNAGKTLHSITNSSMTFKTCIYKTAAVARNANEHQVDPNKAIACLEWSNHHIFNPLDQSFHNLESIDPRALNTEI